MNLTSAELNRRADILESMATNCNLCPRNCRIDRRKKTGYCSCKWKSSISGSGIHMGEEKPVSGHCGSGTVFFSRCNLGCVFCQNYTISFQSTPELTDRELAEIFLQLQSSGCHNINLVTPTPHIASIIRALAVAVDLGFTLPVIYNSGGYETSETLKILEGAIDIYMPDIKTLDPVWASRYLNSSQYPEIVVPAIKEMFRQVGNLQIDDFGIAFQGILVRHLIMPEQADDSKKIIKKLHDLLGTETYLNLMVQYHPCHEAHYHPDLNRKIHPSEWISIRDYAISLKMVRGLENHSLI